MSNISHNGWENFIEILPDLNGAHTYKEYIENLPVQNVMMESKQIIQVG